MSQRMGGTWHRWALLAVLVAGVAAAEEPPAAGSAPNAAAAMAERQRQVLRGMVPNKGFAFFAGYEGSTHNLPAIFAYQGEIQKLVVIGRGYREEFPISQADKALQAYRDLLKQRGYKVGDPGEGRSPLAPQR